MAGHAENQGALHCVPHGDGNQRTFITVPCGHSSLPSGSYFVPSTLPSTVQRALFGQLSRRRDCLLIAWVQPRPLAGYLAALGHASVSSMLMGAHAQTMVPLLTRQAATNRMPKEKDTTGRAGRRSKKSGGVVSRANLARGRTLLTFKLPNMITDTCGIELVWCSDHLEVARVGAAAAEVGWVGECGGSQVICADGGFTAR